MIVCLALVFAAGVIPYKMRRNLRVLQAEQTALTSKKEKAASQHRVLLDGLQALELIERTLRLDCRDLVQTLQAISGRMKELDELVQKRVERQEAPAGAEPEPPEEESTPKDAT
jgi:hypothetical protein